MADMKKVVKGLERCKEGGSCEGCQYDIQSSKCIFLLHADALALLKELNGLCLALEQSNNANEYLNAEVERLNGLLKEQEEKDEPTFDDWTKGEGR